MFDLNSLTKFVSSHRRLVRQHRCITKSSTVRMNSESVIEQVHNLFFSPKISFQPSHLCTLKKKKHHEKSDPIIRVHFRHSTKKKASLFTVLGRSFVTEAWHCSHSTYNALHYPNSTVTWTQIPLSKGTWYCKKIISFLQKSLVGISYTWEDKTQPQAPAQVLPCILVETFLDILWLKDNSLTSVFKQWQSDMELLAHNY